MKNILLLILTLTYINSIAQSNCFQGLIKTDQVGTGTEFILFKSEFELGVDSITLIDLSDKKYNIVFIINEKQCNWNSDYSLGKSEYQIQVKDGRNAELTIISSEKGKVIELYYEHSKEKRVFRISELKPYVYR